VADQEERSPWHLFAHQLDEDRQVVDGGGNRLDIGSRSLGVPVPSMIVRPNGEVCFQQGPGHVPVAAAVLCISVGQDDVTTGYLVRQPTTIKEASAGEAPFAQSRHGWPFTLKATVAARGEG
jgi:hypothetical protein